MKLGVSYNLFDGEELLEFSITNIRPCVQYISVVYQDISNLGNHSNSQIIMFLESLKLKGLIDDIIKYEPNLSLKGHGNEVIKRNIGLESCQRNGCTHFMSMDCDEFYGAKELEHIKSLLSGYDSSACQMQTYYKTSEWAIHPPETYYVPLIYKIDERRFNLNVRWPITADPTRRLDPKNMKVFTRNEIEMHHMSYVRKNIRAKLNNSSANGNWKNRIESLAAYHDNWTPLQKAQFAGSEERFYDVKQVPNYFGINI